jgi:mannose-6-phosphate isomerase-like protein (cupin superfamily)
MFHSSILGRRRGIGHSISWHPMDEGFQTRQLPGAPDAVVSIPAGTHFQFRADRSGPLAAVGVTMPPWPGTDEAYEVPGAWPADLRP